jgi:hypothetical protein
MPQHLVAYSESQDSATLTNIAALADPSVRVSGDDILVPRGFANLAGYYFLGPSFQQGQIVSPSIRRTYPIDVEPADVAAEPSSPSALIWHGSSPIALDETEALNTLMAEDNAGASRVTALIWFSDGPLAPVDGEFFSIRATNTSTLTANAWTNGALTFTSTLPAGRYEIVGARGVSAGMQAFRFVIVGQSHRPGAIGYDADGDLDSTYFRRGGSGVWGEFDHDAPPTVDFLSNSADTSQVCHLDLRKTG